MSVQDGPGSEPEPDSSPTTAKAKSNIPRWPFLVLGGVGVLCVAMVCLVGVAYLTVMWLPDEAALGPRLDRRAEGAVLTDRIAFVGNDRNIWLVDPDGGNLQAVTHDGRNYNFPTWSPDGRHLAFIGLDAANRNALYIYSPTTLTPTVLFDSSASSPFYLYWTPDSRTITFLTQEQVGLAMRLAEVDVPGADRLLERGTPFYWVWSPRGDKLLMHVGGSGNASASAHISILEKRADANRIQLNLSPGRFQAPLWSPDGEAIFYVARDETGQEAIYRANPETLVQQRLAPLSGRGLTYMVISPDNRYLAYLEAENVQPVPVGSLYLMNLDGENRRLLTERSVLSAYWSPDGSKLALLVVSETGDDSTARGGGVAAPAPQEIAFQWWVYHTADGRLNFLTTFDPTLDFVQTIPYFDQYHLSLTFWSPDSQKLVITTADADANQGTVLVVDTIAQTPPLFIGEGTFAVWSWR